MNPDFMRQAIRLSVENVDSNEGGPFGAVVVRDQQVVGTGRNRVISMRDPTAHAEVTAIRDACGRLATFSLEGCEIYTSCEPCPMCLGAIYWARLSSVFYAATCADAAAAGFDDQKLYGELALPIDRRSIPFVQSLRDEACTAFQRWLKKQDRIGY